ncbi:MAG: acyl-CoA thioesterase [Deltaproteobacteria bacterium]|nr:acyl-CoA thioesterase [Deltaproteobacteria bacterium]
MISAHYLVCFGDTDQMGVVYYANYLRMFEFSRVVFMRDCGLPYSQVEAAGFALPVAEAHVRYLAPARFEDRLTIDAALVDLGRASAEFHYRVRRGDRVIATGMTRHACVDGGGRPTRIPDDLRRRLPVDGAGVFD